MSRDEFGRRSFISADLIWVPPGTAVKELLSSRFIDKVVKYGETNYAALDHITAKAKVGLNLG